MRIGWKTAPVLAIAGAGALLSVPAVSRATPPGPPAASPAAQAPGVSLPQQLPPPLPLQAAPVGAPKTAKLDSGLAELERADQAARRSNRAITGATTSLLPADLQGRVAARLLRIDAAGNVQVFVTTDGSVDAGAALAALGMRFETSDRTRNILQGTLPISALSQAAALPSVVGVRPPDYGVVSIGSVKTEGDSILRGDALRSALGTTGQGVRVGVISDGVEGLAASQASGDLPGTVNTATCNAAPAGGGSQPLPTDPGAGAEGTAMLEIVHDIAPGAQLWFGYFGFSVGGTSLNFNQAVNCLAANVDIVVDDVGWFNTGPYDGTSLVSQNTSDALNNPSNRIRGYYTSVGNQAARHYREPYVNSGYGVTSGSDSWVFQRFQGTATTSDAGYAAALGAQCSSGSPGVYCADVVQVAAGGWFTVNLQWDDPFVGSANDYDLFYFDPNDTTGGPTGTLWLASANPQNGGSSRPTEAFGVVNNHGVTTTYLILIGNDKGTAAARTFDMFINCAGCANFGGGSIHNFNTISHSVPNQSDAGGGVVSVGAISASDPGNDTIEYYSSRGPTADSRVKPDVTGIDCVQVTADGGFFSPFCGTSAAAPHLAGLAALLVSCNPVLQAGYGASLAPAAARSTLHDALLTSAVALGGGVPNNTYGYGRADVVAAEGPSGCVDSDGDGYPNGKETVQGENPNSYCAIMRADVNEDGVVNGLDLGTLAMSFTKNVPPAPPRVDLSNPPDGVINGIDLGALALSFLKNVSVCP